jgi:tripartite-type tricarboxylate transporter receptor subunit TctC
MDYIKANRGKLTYGSYGQGSFPHLAGAYLDHITQGGMQHAAYKGEAPCVQDLLGGQIHMTWASAMNLKQHAASGKLKLIGVQGNRRLPALPDLPTLPEAGLKGDAFELVGFLAMAAPAKTPMEIQELLAAEIRKAFTDPAMKERIDVMGYGMVPDSSPQKFLADYKRDAPKWEALVKLSGVKLD